MALSISGFVPYAALVVLTYLRSNWFLLSAASRHSSSFSTCKRIYFFSNAKFWKRACVLFISSSIFCIWSSILTYLATSSFSYLTSSWSAVIFFLRSYKSFFKNSISSSLSSRSSFYSSISFCIASSLSSSPSTFSKESILSFSLLFFVNNFCSSAFLSESLFVRSALS